MGATICRDSESTMNLKDAAVCEIKNSLELENIGDDITENVNDVSAAASRVICRCCQGKVEEAFSTTQLLEAGHSIDLHALRYSIKFEEKNSIKSGVNGSLSSSSSKLESGIIEIREKILAIMNFSVPLPSWTN